MQQVTSSVRTFLQALQDDQVFQAFQANPVALSAEYGVDLTPKFAAKLQQNFQGVNSLADARAMGKSGFRMSCGPESPDTGGGHGGGYALPGITLPELPFSA